MFEWPIPSLLRSYSAPIHLESSLSDSDPFFLIAHELDEFNQLGSQISIGKEAYAQHSSRFPARQTIGSESQFCAQSQMHTF
ncbi:hypothetical protein SLA2020_345890 [Shorea laevis]